MEAVVTGPAQAPHEERALAGLTRRGTAFSFCSGITNLKVEGEGNRFTFLKNFSAFYIEVC